MIKLQNKLGYLIIAAMLIGFTGCGSDENDNDNIVGGGDIVTIKITNLPNETNGMGGEVLVYTQKPIQFVGIGDGIAGATLMNGAGMLISASVTGSNFYQGGEGYILLQTIPRLGIDKYFHFISKNKVTLKKGENVFDFANDFEILHDYGGSGILRIEDVPDIYEGSIGFNILDYSEAVGNGGLGKYEEALKAKPLGRDGDHEQSAFHTADYLALPMSGYTNQEYDLILSQWKFDLTYRRFDMTGTFFVSFPSSAFQEGKPLNEIWDYYADQVTFTNGNATIKWADIKKVINSN
jgi:hypothetical protein